MSYVKVKLLQKVTIGMGKGGEDFLVVGAGLIPGTKCRIIRLRRIKDKKLVPENITITLIEGGKSKPRNKNK
jgi:hypothetical protein